MTTSQQLREQMWDLVYGLLEAEESQALIAHIKSDPQVARLYAEVRLQADLVGYAARVEDAAFVLNTDASEHRPTPPKRERSAAAAGKPAAAGRRKSKAGGSSWLAVGAATALAALLAAGQFWPRASEQQLAAAYIITEVEAPPTIPGGLGNSLAFHTTTLAGDAQPATVDFAIRGRGGQELYRQQVQTNDVGRADVAVPGSALEPGVRLEVFDVAASANAASAGVAIKEVEKFTRHADAAAESKGKAIVELAADLPVQAEPQMAYILLEEPLSEADKPVNASVWNFGAFSGKPAPAETAEQVAQNIPGLAITEENEAAAAASEQGVFKGVVQNQSPNRGAVGFAYQNNFNVPQVPVPFAESATPQPQTSFGVAPGQAGAQAGAAPGSSGAVRLQRAGEGANRPDNQSQRELAQSADGYARFRANRGEAGGSNAAAVTNVAPGEPINVEIPPEYAGKRLVAAANARGVMVANTNIAAESKEQTVARSKLGQLAENVQINLPPEADGPIEVAVLDPASSPPQVVSRNYVYREPARKLQIDVRDLKERFDPGERVQVTLAVRDEAGRPAADTRLGVRLWNEQLVQQNAEQPLLLADALQAGLPGATINSPAATQIAASQMFRATEPPIEALAKEDSVARPSLADPSGKAEAAKDGERKLAAPIDDAAAIPRDEAQAKQQSLGFARAGGQSLGRAPAAPAALPASGGSQPSVDAFAAGDYLVPQTEWFSDFVSEAAPTHVELATNRPAVQAAYDAAAGVARAERQQTVRAIGGLAIAGGAALLVLLAVLAARRMAGGYGVVLPALGVSLASLLIGFAWVGWLPRGNWQPQIAMNSGAVPAATEIESETTTDGLPRSGATLSLDAADADATPTISLAEPAGSPATSSLGSVTSDRESSAPKSAESLGIPNGPLTAGGAFGGKLAEQQRQAGQGGFGGAAGVATPGAAPTNSDGRDRLAAEPLERGLARAPAKAAKDIAEQVGDKSAADLAAVPAQPLPKLAAAAPPAPAVAPAATAPAQPAAARPDSAALADNKNEGEARRAQLAAPGRGGTPNAQAPASLYFNPNLKTNDQGLATIEFTLPPGNSQYRLLIDALGQGRIGSRQELITGQSEAAK